MGFILSYSINLSGSNRMLFYTSISVLSIVGTILIITVVKVMVHTILTLASKFRQFAKSYGEDKLHLRTIKRIGNLNFIKVLYYESIQQKIISPIRQIYYPSIVSLITTLIVSLIFFYLPGNKLPTTVFLEYLQSNFYQNYIAIHVGIGAVIFPLIILVAETSDSGKNQDKARVILRETLLFPLVTLEIISLVLFAIGVKNFGAIFSVFIIGGLTIRAIFMVIRLLINRYLFQENERKIVNDRFSTSLDQAVKERIDVNTLLEYFEKSEYAIRYSYFRSSKENIKTISLSKNGVLKDIHLGKLERLLKDIEKEANQIGLSIKKIPQKEKEAGIISNVVSEQNEKVFSSVEIYILKLIGGQIVEDSKGIIAIPKSLFDIEELRTRIQSSVESIFKIEPKDSIEKEIRLELDETKDKAFLAIEESRIGILGSIMDTYVELIDQFLNVFQSYGGGYTSESAKRELNSLFGGWPYVKWIKEDLRDVISETIRSEKDKLIREVTYIPMKILYKAFIKRDHLIFQEFVSFQPYLYWEAQNIHDKRIRNFLIDRASRYLREFVDYRITPDIEDPDLATSDITHVKDFVYEILQSYKNLLKYSFDRKDVKSFKKFLTDAQNILHRFEPTKEYRKVEIELQLKAQNVTELQKKELEEKLNRITIFEETEANIKLRKRELTIGFASWCLYKLKGLNFKDQDLLDIWNCLSPYLPTQLEDLFEIYESSYKHNNQEFWGWDWWEMDENNEDEDGIISTSINFDEKIHTLFALLLLKILKGKTLAQVDTSKINISRDSSFYFENDDSVVKSKLIEIINNQTQWQKVLSTDEANTKDVAIGLLTALVTKQKQKELIQLINTQIDPIKVKKFIESFVNAYEKEISLRRILDICKAVSSISTLSKSKGYWGFNEIQDKEPFTSFGHVDYSGYGDHYGRGLGESEDQIIFGQIRSNSTVVKNGQSLSEAIRIAVKELEDNEFKPKTIFTTFHLGEWHRATLDKAEFIPSWKTKGVEYSNIPNFIGLYKSGRKKIPIYRIWVNESKKEISEVIVTDVNKFIRLEQYPPFLKETERTEMDVRGNLAFKITDLSANVNKPTRDKLISENPTWLQKEINKDNFLKQKVIVHVKEKFEMKILDKKASVKIVI
jgi:hypothetical protein